MSIPGRYTVWQDGQRVATVECTVTDRALKEAMHYVWTYEQDGPVVLKRGNRIVYRTPNKEQQ